MPRIDYRNAKGERLQGVTTIAKNIDFGSSGPLMWWANKQGLEGKTLQEAYDTATIPGTIAHRFIECYLKSEDMKLEPIWTNEEIAKGKRAFDNFLIWAKNWELEVMFVEPNLVSENWQYGGTPDLIAKSHGKVCLIDWKTSAALYPQIFVQLTAYDGLVSETLGLSIEGFHVLRIPKNQDIPGFSHRYWEKMPLEAWQCFVAALNVGKWGKVLKSML